MVLDLGLVCQHVEGKRHADIGYFKKDDECNVYDYEYDEHDRKESELYDGLIKFFELYFNPTR